MDRSATSRHQGLCASSPKAARPLPSFWMTGRAIAVLAAVVLDEGGLQGMQIIGRAKTFDRGGPVSVVLERGAQAGVDPRAIHDHGAGSAWSVVAILLGFRCSRSA